MKIKISRSIDRLSKEHFFKVNPLYHYQKSLSIWAVTLILLQFLHSLFYQKSWLHLVRFLAHVPLKMSRFQFEVFNYEEYKACHKLDDTPNGNLLRNLYNAMTKKIKFVFFSVICTLWLILTQSKKSENKNVSYTCPQIEDIEQALILISQTVIIFEKH